MDLAIVIPVGALVLAGMGFMFGMFYWLITRMDRMAELFMSRIDVTAKNMQDQVTLIRSNDLTHIYSEMKELRAWLQQIVFTKMNEKTDGV